MKAIILGAGQGKRLLPMTEQDPKALLDIGGKRLVEWQIAALVKSGVDEIVFVSGFNTARVEKALGAVAKDGGYALKIVHNPFYTVADNISSCWLARGEMTDDFMLLNGDTLFRAPLVARLLESPAAPVTLCVDQKESYDQDDMKVYLDGTRLTDIGKTLPLEGVNAESIGVMVFRGEGPALFARYLEESLRDPAALKLYYLSVIRRMAQDGVEVRTASIKGLPWCEVDYPLDLKRAQQLVATWHDGEEDEAAYA